MTIEDFDAEARTQIGLVSSLFGPPTDDLNMAMLGTLEEYLDAYRPYLRTFWENDTGKPRKFGERERAYPRRRLSRPGKTVYVDATGSNSIKEASSWQVTAEFVRQDRGLSGVEWSVSPMAKPDDIVAFFLRAASATRYLHGNAGYGIVLPIDRVARQMEGTASIALAARFAGLDSGDLMSISIRGIEGIKCVNWLTAVDDALLDKLGGRALVSKSFGADILCHQMPNGLVIQAGPRPVLGDKNRPDELAYYRQVARVLRPIYAPELYLEGLRDDTHDMLHTTTAWRNRFFEGARWP